MPDYKKMYLGLFAATEQTIAQLIAAQQAAEEVFVAQEDAPFLLCDATAQTVPQWQKKSENT